MEDELMGRMSAALEPQAGDVSTGFTHDAARQDEDALSAWDGMVLSAKNDWVTSEVTRFFRDNGEMRDARASGELSPYDDTFVPTEEQLAAVVTEYGIPEQFIDQIAQADGEDHMVWIAQNMQGRIRAYEDINRALPGMFNPARFVVNALDPLPLLAGGVLGKVTQGGLRASTILGRAANGAAANLAVDIPLESARVGLNPIEGRESLMYSLAGSALFGGVLGSFGGRLTPAEREQLVRAQHTAEFGSSSVGAAKVQGSDLDSTPLNRAADDRGVALEEAGPIGYSFAPGWRFDLESSLNSSTDAPTRDLTQRLISSQAGLADGAVNRHAAADYQRRIHESHGRFHRIAQEGLQAYWKEQGVRLVGPNREADFYQQVAWAIDDSVNYRSDNAHVNRAADAYRDLFEDALGHVKDDRFEVGGGGQSNLDFENIEARRGYFPHQVHVDNYHTIRQDLGGDEGVVKALSAPIFRGNDVEIRRRAAERGTTPVKEAQRVARAYLMTIRSLRSGLMDRYASRTMTEGDIIQLREKAVEEARATYDNKGKFDEFDEDAITDAIDMIIPRRTDVESTHAKERMNLSLDPEVDRAIMKLWNWDARRVSNAYSRHMSGLAGILRAGFRSEAEVDAKITDIRSRGGALDNDGVNNTNRNIDHLEYLKNSILGRRHKPQTEFDKTLELGANWLKRWAFTRYLNNVGFSMMSEVGGVLAQGAFLRTIRQVPKVWDMYRAMHRGETPKGLVPFVDAMFGAGSQQVRSRLNFRESLNESVNIDASASRGGWVDKVDDGTRRVSNAASKMSGMSPLNELMRLSLLSSEVETWARNAIAGKQHLTARRLAWLGLDEKTFASIQENLARSTEIDTANGGRVMDVRIDEWADQDAAQAFIQALDRNSRRVVLEGDIGGRARWMEDNPVAGIVMQFLNFTLNAHTKHLMFGMNVRDARAVNELIMFSTFGALGYMARVHAVTLGMNQEERTEYLSTHFTPAKIGQAAFYYSAHASFVPQAHDTVASLIPGYDLRIASVRSSSMRGEVFDTGSYPIAAGINDAFRGIQGITRDGEVEREDVKNLARGLMPLQNAWYLSWLLTPLINSFPEDDDAWDLDE